MTVSSMKTDIMKMARKLMKWLRKLIMDYFREVTEKKLEELKNEHI